MLNFAGGTGYYAGAVITDALQFMVGIFYIFYILITYRLYTGAFFKLGKTVIHQCLVLLYLLFILRAKNKNGDANLFVLHIVRRLKTFAIKFHRFRTAKRINKMREGEPHAKMCSK